ncbi:MAG: hypothetical protein HY716_13635 [Planctomycetes bacterium]|nr:hypothetical protein [Planctomycetota bacterium]
MRVGTMCGLLFLTACAGREPARPPDHGLEMAVIMSLGIQDTSGLKVGQWALYEVRREGSPTPQATKISVVRQEGECLWVEQRMPVGDRMMIYKAKVDRAGRKLEIWGGEAGTRDPRKIYPPMDPSGRPIEPPPNAEAEPKMEVRVVPERLNVGGRVYDCSRIESTSSYTEGLRTQMVTWCSPDVPFKQVYAGKSYGGVVRRTYGRYTMEIKAYDINPAIPEELPLPR